MTAGIEPGTACWLVSHADHSTTLTFPYVKIFIYLNTFYAFYVQLVRILGWKSCMAAIGEQNLNFLSFAQEQNKKDI